MTIWEFLWIAAVAAAFVALVFSACTADPRKEHYDTPCFRNIAIIVTGIMLYAALYNAARGPQLSYVERYPMRFSMWNRYTRSSAKYGFQITNYRKPDPHLPPAEYMMGVEMAKTNTCHDFDFSRDVDIDRFNRCANFFPELKDEYRTYYEERVGICV